MHVASQNLTEFAEISDQSLLMNTNIVNLFKRHSLTPQLSDPLPQVLNSDLDIDAL